MFYTILMDVYTFFSHFWNVKLLFKWNVWHLQQIYYCFHQMVFNPFNCHLQSTTTIVYHTFNSPWWINQKFRFYFVTFSMHSSLYAQCSIAQHSSSTPLCWNKRQFQISSRIVFSFTVTPGYLTSLFAIAVSFAVVRWLSREHVSSYNVYSVHNFPMTSSFYKINLFILLANLYSSIAVVFYWQKPIYFHIIFHLF